MSTAIHQEVVLKATPTQIYAALVDAKQFSKITGGAPTEISSDAGGVFSCFGGMITGRQIELVPNQRIVQAWRAGNWEAGLYSIVRFELREQGSGTKLLLDHVGFPEGAADHLEAGWKANYFEPLEKYLA